MKIDSNNWVSKVELPESNARSQPSAKEVANSSSPAKEVANSFSAAVVQAANKEQTDDSGKTKNEEETVKVKDAYYQSPYETKYNIDPKTHQLYFQIYDRETQEMVREVPPQKIRQLMDDMTNLNNTVDDKG